MARSRAECAFLTMRGRLKSGSLGFLGCLEYRGCHGSHDHAAMMG
jgi:hypothetical protein